jgi:hypothetical protein
MYIAKKNHYWGKIIEKHGKTLITLDVYYFNK